MLSSCLALGSATARLHAGEGPPARPAFSEVTIRSGADLRALRKKLGSEGILLLEKVNRRDRTHMRAKTRLAVPAPPLDFDVYSPFPVELERLNGIPKAVLVSLRVQAFGAYEKGRLVRWGPVSTGGSKHQTPAGLYHTNWRSRRRVSTLNSHWIMPWYFNLHTSMGVAFHEYAIPGRPQSFGCIRLLKEDARWIYSWADVWIPPIEPGTPPRAFGTPVIVFAAYDYASPAPWRNLANDPASADVDRAALERALEKYLSVVRQRTTERLSLEQVLESESRPAGQGN